MEIQLHSFLTAAVYAGVVSFTPLQLSLQEERRRSTSEQKAGWTFWKREKSLTVAWNQTTFP
jgi:hypothetical protein